MDDPPRPPPRLQLCEQQGHAEEAELGLRKARALLLESEGLESRGDQWGCQAAARVPLSLRQRPHSLIWLSPWLSLVA